MGIRIEPREAVSAAAEPEMPPKKYEATILTWARPPRIQPTRELASAISLSDMPPDPINTPIVIKKGTAIRENDHTPLTICWGSETRFCPIEAMHSTVEMPTA